ncbi:HlyD family efflux transporter periplasmic adaptor subunit [Shewanella sp. 202IG2-18]|uniref:HlyD family secretion protein n=1 Tax=Parashewanella hymeniacidonis TaxID=2807618 RepID=UPI001961A9B5|nr:biotin/lipoyl-binding protein [Parashewanella hymeniacidonis]MBM7071880.1 HlyD family efflux transporter periplasmic adaptor subunit [Parashewanella hymeniacidonis]
MQKWLGLILVVFLCACSKQSDQALGTLERDRITFSATGNEIIRQLPFHEGAQVKVGDVLVKLDTKHQNAITAQAHANVAKATAVLAKLTNGERPEDIAVASANVQQAKAKDIEVEKRYRRVLDLFQRKLTSRSELDSVKANRDTARAGLRSAQEALTKLTRGARLEDIEQAKAELDAAQAQRDLESQRLADLTVVATRNGVLDSLPYKRGERVPLNGIVAVVLADNAPYARVYIPASKRLNFTIGKQVVVNVDGVKQPYLGTVRKVSDEPAFTPYYALTEQQRSHLVYLAEITLPEAAERLPSGVPVQIDLSKVSTPPPPRIKKTVNEPKQVTRSKGVL